MSSYQYRKSHCGDKTVLRSSYLHNGISYTGRTTSLHWVRAQDIFPSGHCSEIRTNTHGSTYFRWILGTSVISISTNTRTVGFYAESAIQWKCLCTPNCTYIENMLMNFIKINLFNISPMQTILYQFKSDMIAWKRPGCPQCMQRTWW